MGTMGSSFLSASESTLNVTNSIPYQPSSTLNNVNRNEKMPVIADVMSMMDSPKLRKRSKTPRTSIVNYGPIKIRKRHTTAPTIATGRRSRHAILDDEEAIKREIRRKKNREAAKTLKRTRDNIENQLKIRLKQLESEEILLLKTIESLQYYKQHLEERYQQSNSMYEFLTHTSHESFVHYEQKFQSTSQTLPTFDCFSIEPKEEPHSPSPQWQLLFSL